MAKTEMHVQLAPPFTWRTLAGLFEEAWHREGRRRRGWLVALVILMAAGVIIVALTGAGGNRPTEGGANVALAHKPDSASAGGRDLPAATSLTFVTLGPDKPVPVGVTKTLKVQLVGHLTKPAERGGVPVYLTQAMFTTTGVTHAWANINRNRVGDRGVAFTNARGIAKFAITGTKASSVPTTFDAVLGDSARRSHGASGYLTLRFSALTH
jgi:hypothetical protein